MNTELFLKPTISSPKHHGKLTNDNSFIDLQKYQTQQKQHQVAMFRASKLHARGTDHGKQEHVMLELNALNKTPSLSIVQKHMDLMTASMQNGKLCWQFQTQQNKHGMAEQI